MVELFCGITLPGVTYTVYLIIFDDRGVYTVCWGTDEVVIVGGTWITWGWGRIVWGTGILTSEEACTSTWEWGLTFTMGGREKYWGGWKACYCCWGMTKTRLWDWLTGWGWFCGDEGITGIVWDFLIGKAGIAWKFWWLWCICELLGDTITWLTLWLIGIW